MLNLTSRRYLTLTLSLGSLHPALIFPCRLSVIPLISIPRKKTKIHVYLLLQILCSFPVMAVSLFLRAGSEGCFTMLRIWRRTPRVFLSVYELYFENQSLTIHSFSFHRMISQNPFFGRN